MMRIGAFEFRPRAVPTVAAALLLGVLIALGVWQLARAHDKQALVERFEARREALPAEMTGMPPPESDLRFRRVQARGRYDTAHQLLVDNQVHEGRPGFHVITPLELDADGAVVLVNRGWVAMGEGRRDLPSVPAPEEPVTVVGTLVDPPQPGLRLGAPGGAREGWPRVVQYVDPEWVTEQLGRPVIGHVLRLSPEAPHGFEREWGPPAVFGPARHRAYAVQWFAMAAVLLIIYVTTQTRRHGESEGS